VRILRVTAEENRQWQGRTLAEAAAARGTGPLETAMDLIASDRSLVQAAYFSRLFREFCGAVTLGA
jgi:N-acyl-D-aspartate/D-glutamate deacylase